MVTGNIWQKKKKKVLETWIVHMLDSVVFFYEFIWKRIPSIKKRGGKGREAREGRRKENLHAKKKKKIAMFFVAVKNFTIHIDNDQNTE